MQRTVKNLLKEKGNDVWSIPPAASVFEAIASMADRSVGALLVIDDDRLVGIISERDYMKKVLLKDRSSKGTRVEQIMVSPVFYVEQDRTVEECMALMTERRFRHLPVLDNERVIGVISIGDVVKSVIEERGILIEQLERYITGHA